MQRHFKYNQEIFLIFESFSPLGEKDFATERQAHPILDPPSKIHNILGSDLHGPHPRNCYDFPIYLFFPIVQCETSLLSRNTSFATLRILGVTPTYPQETMFSNFQQKKSKRKTLKISIFCPCFLVCRLFNFSLNNERLNFYNEDNSF